MKGDSTTNQLLYIVHQIRSAWQKGNICQAAFADVEGAFEKVWHTGLLAKLEQAVFWGLNHPQIMKQTNFTTFHLQSV